MSASAILVEHPAKGVTLLRINRPEARNALDMPTRRLLVQHLAEADEDESVRCLVIAGNETVFAAGADIKEMADAGSIEMMRRGSHKLWSAIAACSKPIVASVRGLALGGGCELAMICDIIVAGHSARFGQPEIRIGIIPGGGGTQRLTRVIGKHKAMRYLLTGDLFSAADAQAMGLVSELVPDAEVDSRAIAMAAQIAALSPLAVRQAKEVILRGMDAALETGIALEIKALHVLFSSQDQKEGMKAFIEKRKPDFTGR